MNGKHGSCSKNPLQTCDCETNLYSSLYECCQRAYKSGINSVDIYKTLHSTSSSKKVQTALLISNTNSKISNAINNVNHEPAQTRTDNRRLISLIQQNFINLNSSNKLFLIFVLLGIFIPFIHFTICLVYNLNPLKFSNLIETRCLISLHPTILEMVRPIANCTALCHNNPNWDHFNQSTTIFSSPTIEFKSWPTTKEFAEIAYSSRPIIVRNSSSTTMKPFHFFILKEIFESEPGGIESVSDECQFLPFRSSFTTLSDAFEKISAGHDDEHKLLPISDPWYIGWSNCHSGVATKLRNLFPRPEFLPFDSESSIIDWIFIGSPGLGAAMHVDYVRRPSWQIQISGTKRWVLKPPPECESECPELITFTANTGDIVFLETNLWYHSTFIEGNELSISIGSEYD